MPYRSLADQKVLAPNEIVTSPWSGRKWLGASFAVLAVVSIVAQAQSVVSSPFATQKKKQAWETEAPAPPAPPVPSVLSVPSVPSGQTAPIQSPIQSFGQSSGQHFPQAQTAPTGVGSGQALAGQAQQAPSRHFIPQTAPANGSSQQGAFTYTSPNSASVGYNGASQAVNTSAASAGGTYYPGRLNGGQALNSSAPDQNALAGVYQAPPSQALTPQAQTYQNQAYQNQAYQGQNYQNQNYQAQSFQNQSSQGQAYQGPVPPQSRPQKRSWLDRLGFGNLATTLFGHVKGGAAGTNRDGPNVDEWDADFVLDGRIVGEVSAITDGGLEYGIGGEVRGQYDQFRRGFGGLVGDCPVTVPECNSVNVNGTQTALRGHTSQFHNAGISDANDGQVALEGAYIFLRSGFGDVTIGRDDGAAYQFSLGAPTLLAIGVSNSSVDYTGLDSVKTVNDASGFAEKVTYTSPRLLGDQIGIGVQFGVSYALDASVCGTDFCARRDRDIDTATLSPDIENIVEFGVALDRKFDNGLEVEATATYARGGEQSDLVGLANLNSYNFGLELKWQEITFGGSYLQSNNGLDDGDYTAWDVGATWKPNQWGFTLGYGEAEDDNALIDSRQAVFGVTYDVGKYRLGAGVQYIDRDVPIAPGGVLGFANEEAAALFVEAGITF